MSNNKEKAVTNNSLLSMYIFETLRRYSDKEHPMTENQIKEKLNETEDFSISVEKNRKVIPSHTRAIMNYLPGFIVEIKVPVSETSKKYICKWYYNGRKAQYHSLFTHNYCTPNEVKFLVDMISSNQLLTTDGSNAFISKLLKSINVWEEEKIRNQLQADADYYKNENETIRSIYAKLTDAIDGEKRANIIFESDCETQTILSACVHAVYETNGIQHTYVTADEQFDGEISLPQIKKVTVLKCNASSNDLTEDKLDSLGIEDDRSIDSNIEMDTLFSNIEQINQSIVEKRYLKFNDYHSPLLEFDIEMPTRTIIPLKTRFHNGKYYLIAIEKSEGKTDFSVFIRIDLMENVRLGRLLTNSDLAKSDNENAKSYMHTDPHIKAKTEPIKITFYIKKEAIHRAVEAFGNSAYAEEDVSPLETATGIRKKIAEHDPEFFTQAFTGFDANDELIEVSAEAIEEDVIRWALENADAVEIKSPEHLRLKLKEMTDTLHTRYSKNEYDIFEEQYRKVISGEEPLVYGGSGKYQDRIIERIIQQNAYDKITKLAIESRYPLSMEDLAKYSNIESLRIEGDAISDFSFLKNYTKLSQLTLIHTSLTDGNIIVNISNLQVLFIHRNKISDYSFLKKLKNVSAVYLGHNEATDLSPLYELDGVEELIIEEDVLAQLDIEKLLFGSNCHIMQRWIDDGWYRSFPKRYQVNYTLYKQKI